MSSAPVLLANREKEVGTDAEKSLSFGLNNLFP